MLKIVIWGLGTNGKNFIDVIDKENVIAIIESNQKKKNGGCYKGIPVIEFETYMQNYSSYYLVVTPMSFENILQILKDNHVYRYFVLCKSKVRLAVLLSLKEGSFQQSYGIERYKNYYIEGINIFSIYLYYYLRKEGISTKIIRKDDCEVCYDLERQKLVEFCDIADIEKRSCIIQTENSLRIRDVEYQYFDYQYLNKIQYQKWSEDLKQFKNCCAGARVFIVATGPSLKKEDLDKLHTHKEVTIGVNGIIYMLEKTLWRPDYYVASDGEMIRIYEESNISGLDQTDKFFSDNYLKYCCKNLDKRYHCFHQEQDIYNIQFSDDFSERVYAGSTVVYACLQLAAYMGAREIILIGCDFSFLEDMDSAENHCYGLREKGYTFDFDMVLKAYQVARQYAHAHGIEIFNATRGGKLEVFPRVDFDSLFT